MQKKTELNGTLMLEIMRSKREQRIRTQKIISTLLAVSLIVGAIYMYINYQPSLFSG